MHIDPDHAPGCFLPTTSVLVVVPSEQSEVNRILLDNETVLY